jgi:cyclopropane-fatty-acyl-phospholipid synthase
MIQLFEQQSFSLCALTDLTPHYIRTIEQWQRNLLSNRDAVESFQPGLAADFARYFETAILALRYTVKQYALVASKNR